MLSGITHWIIRAYLPGEHSISDQLWIYQFKDEQKIVCSQYKSHRSVSMWEGPRERNRIICTYEINSDKIVHIEECCVIRYTMILYFYLNELLPYWHIYLCTGSFKFNRLFRLLLIIQIYWAQQSKSCDLLNTFRGIILFFVEYIYNDISVFIWLLW